MKKILVYLATIYTCLLANGTLLMHLAMAYETLHPVTFWFILKVVVTITCCIKVVIFVCVITRTVVFGNSCMLYSRSSLEDVSGDGSLTFLGLPQLLDYYAHHTSIHLGYNIVGEDATKWHLPPTRMVASYPITLHFILEH